MPPRNRFEKHIDKILPNDFKYEAIRLPYQIEHKYVPDWVFPEQKLILEAKGRFDPADRRKQLAIKAQQPDWQVILIFYDPNRTLTKKSKTRYCDWADKHQIKWTTAEQLQCTIRGLLTSGPCCNQSITGCKPK